MMKNILLLLFSICSLNVNALIVNIPDANFKNYLVNEPFINTNGDTEIQVSEANSALSINIISNLGITDLTGIETFTSLIDVNLMSNPISHMDFSNSPDISYLDINGTPISSIDLSQNLALQYFHVYNCGLTELDLSLNTNLTEFYCYGNQLTSLNIANGNNTAITSANISNNSNLNCVLIDSPTSSLDLNAISYDPHQTFSSTCTVLPVEFIHFQAEKQAKQIRLNWQTASEINNKGFHIEHSLDGRNFQNIGFVSGQGTISSPKDYEFMHYRPAPSSNYYRLKQMDYDGAFEYSNIVVVEMPKIGSSVIFYPNPSRGQVNIRTSIKEGVVVINDINGDAVYISDFQGETVDITQLSKGLYFISFITKKETFTEKIFKE